MLNEFIIGSEKRMKFKKMHGIGNDFVIINNMDLAYDFSKNLIEELCKNHYGIGADGFISVEPSIVCDAKMRYYNNDGKEAEMCGNGIRCFGKYVFDEGIISKKYFLVETLAGEIGVKIIESKKRESMVEVFMGQVRFESESIPVITQGETLLNGHYCYKGMDLVYGCASMGNPHMVIITEDIQGLPTGELGPYFESHPMYPEKCNVNFVKIINRNKVDILTWERGVGFTEACGTGTCATVAVLEKLGKTNHQVTAYLPGGELYIRVLEEDIYMTGSATTVFTGEIDLIDFKRNGETP